MAIDESEFRAANNSAHNLTEKMLKTCQERVERHIARYLVVQELGAIADRGYFSGQELLACERLGVPA